MALTLKAILGLDGSGFEVGIKRAQSQVDKFASNLRSGVNSRLGQFLTAAVAAEAMRKTIAYAGTINDLSERLAISTDAIQQWEFAALQAGGTAEGVASFFEKLATSRDKALGGGEDAPKALAAFEKFGISKEQLQGMRLQDIGLKIGNVVKNGDAQKFIASLREVGGRGATSLIAAFKGGLEEAFGNAPLIKTEDIIRLDAIGDEIQSLGKKLMTGLSPVISFIGKSFLRFMDMVQASVAAIPSFLGALTGGASLSEAHKIAHDQVQDLLDESDAREKRIQDQINASKLRGKEEAPGPQEVTEKIKKEKLKKDDGLNINSLQQIGALVSSSNPMQTALQKNTEALNRNTEKIIKLAPPPVLPPKGSATDKMGGISYG